MIQALAFTPSSLFKLSQFSIGPEWFELFGLPMPNGGLKRVQVGDVVYLIEDSLQDDAGRLVVLNLTPEAGVFSQGAPRTNVLDRIITVARSLYTPSVVIPTGWRRHQEGSVVSIQAPTKDRNWRARLHFDTRPHGTGDLFAFLRTDDIVDFPNLERYEAVHASARQGFPDAILTASPMEVAEDTRAGIVLSQRLPQGFVQGASLDQWYETKLTKEQRSFVDKRHDGPVRLRGSAGTGKTLSLVVKFLRDAIESERAGKAAKVCFLTHSSASVDLVGAICESLDVDGVVNGQGRHVRLEVRTIYDLAYEHLNFELDELVPLSLDGREGRRLQAELIEAVLKDVMASPIAMAGHADVDPELMARWRATCGGTDRRLVGEVMNEFASVLDAENVRAGEEKGERYAKSAHVRPSWLMALPNEQDRRLILDLHRRYRKLLGAMNTLSVDQMVGDFNAFLDSNRWDRVRGRQGFDALFVDELHLFTSVERQVLHKLIRRNVEENGLPIRPPIFMAYDLKQSPRDTFAQYGSADTSLFSPSTGLQNSDLIRLDRVFRYTPQIAEFLADLDATFPAIDVPGEWEAYAGKAELEDAVKPDLTVYKDDVTLFQTVLKEAHRIARSCAGGGRRVAVLCASAEMFDRYVEAASGQFEGKHIALTSREPVSELRHAGKRFILSMPEYVAGLQFETVFLIHVDASEALSDAGDGIRRRFISNIYLGSSRAEKALHLCAALSRGGASDILGMALERRSLIEAPPPGPRRV